MFRVILSFLVILFLFVGLIGTTDVLFRTNNSDDQKVIAQLSEKKNNKLSIKEIESLTASSNFYFTSENSLK